MFNVTPTLTLILTLILILTLPQTPNPECMTFVPATIAPVINANVKRNPNPNPNPNLISYPTPSQTPNHYPHSNSLLPRDIMAGANCRWSKCRITGIYQSISCDRLQRCFSLENSILQWPYDKYDLNISTRSLECTTFAPKTIAPVKNANVKHNPNPNPNPNLNLYPTPNQKPRMYDICSCYNCSSDKC